MNDQHNQDHPHHTTPYGVIDIAGALLDGGRPVLQVGTTRGFHRLAEDVGCAVTALVSDAESFDDLRSSGHEAHLVDLDDAAMLELLGSRQFEQVVALNLLEESVDPGGMLRALTKHLTPSGQIIVRAQNAAHVDVALMTLLGRAAWSSELRRPGHLYDRSTVEMLLSGAGLSIVELVEVHRLPSSRLFDELRRLADVELESLSELVRGASSVAEWVIVTSLSPDADRHASSIRRLLDDSIARARVIDEASAYSRSLEARLSSAEAELADERSRHRTDVDALQAELDDALRLEREVVWQRELVAEIGVRLETTERRLAEVEETYANAMELVAITQAELDGTRRRLGFVVMDRLARRLFRHRLLVALTVTPLRRIMNLR